MKKKKVSEEFAFWLKGGAEINDLEELVDELDVMERQVFKYHVNKGKNDFAIWIKKSLGMPKLAKRIQNVKNPASMAKIIEQHLEKEPPKKKAKKKTTKKKAGRKSRVASRKSKVASRKAKAKKRKAKKKKQVKAPSDIETVILAAVVLVGIGAVCLLVYTL